MSDNDDSRPRYNVGRGKPPVEHQFIKGRPSPNPAGRPRKAARSLTERQPVFDIIRVAGQPVGLRRNGKVVRTTMIEAIWESVAAKAAGGHAPSQRFFIKEYKACLALLRQIYPEFLRIIDHFENAAARGGGITGKNEQEELDHLRRRTHQLVGGYDERKDPHSKRQKVKHAEALARRAERDALGIKPAKIDMIDLGIVVEDPDDSRQLLIGTSSKTALARVLQCDANFTFADLMTGLTLINLSYDEIAQLLRQHDVPHLDGPIVE